MASAAMLGAIAARRNSQTKATLASAAMLGAIAAQQNAKKKLIEFHKFQPDAKLTDAQARRVKAQLRSDSKTAFLSYIVEGKSSNRVSFVLVAFTFFFFFLLHFIISILDSFDFYR